MPIHDSVDKSINRDSVFDTWKKQVIHRKKPKGGHMMKYVEKPQWRRPILDDKKPSVHPFPYFAEELTVGRLNVH